MGRIILIVDDEEINRDILAGMLEDKYEILEAPDGKKALDIINKNHNSIVAVLLDLMMPVMDGYSVLEKMKESSYTDSIPTLIISSEESVSSEERCFDLGVVDFIHKPFDHNLVRKRVENATELYIYKNKLEERIREQTIKLQRQNDLLKEQAEKLKTQNARITDILGTVVEYRDIESGEHIQRVKDYTNILAKKVMEMLPEYGLTEEKINKITAASALHDVGKISIPDCILLKPGRLTEEEYSIMKKHTTKGCEILDQLKDEWDSEYVSLSYDICRYHHERYDGGGYPEGLKGIEIPLAAQLVGVADAYDALVNERCYKKAFKPEEAYNMIVNGECGQFAPDIMECFGKVKDNFKMLAMGK